MKNKKKIIITLIVLMVCILSIITNNLLKDKKIIINNINRNESDGIISLMLETGAGTGEYKESSSNTWPEGYILNEKLSKCENGSTMEYDKDTNKINVKSKSSDKCYIFFDRQSFAAYIKALYTSQGSNNLYHHDGTLTNGISDDSYRYSGSYETTNNWVCFGKDDSTKVYSKGWCDDEHLYRIIGVFDSKVVGSVTGETELRVKLIKAYEGTEDSLGTASDGTVSPNSTYYKGNLSTSPGYYWNSSSNEWGSSLLNINILNGTYLTELDKDENGWTDKIAETEWKIGGVAYVNINDKIPSIAYQNEIVTPSTTIVTDPNYNAKIGLMYVSDYGFASSTANWNTVLGGYNNDTNRENNWLYLGVVERTISPAIYGSYKSFVVAPVGNIGVCLSDDVTGAIPIRPTFYLNSSVAFAGGSGTVVDPYRVA